MERRLAAIVSADVVGYSRLVRADEEGTLAALKALRQELIEPVTAEHGGRIVKLMGDGVLTEFASVVDAVRAAATIQQRVAERNGGAPPDRRIEFRVGINLGDVVIDGDDIQGDGVNVAARLEALAEPGGMCITAAVNDQIRDRLDLQFEDMGDQQVKNIDRPIRVWRWPAAESQAQAAQEPNRADHKPLLAVLSFETLGADPALSDLGRVLTRDVTTEMAGRTGFTLVAASTVARFEGVGDLAMDAVRDRLGADFVLCGIVTGNDERVRVQVELIETAGGTQIWAERYDRARGDLLSLADDLTDVIVQTSRTATNAYIGALYDDTPDDALSNNERLAKAARHFYQLTPVDYERALAQIDLVLAREPDHAMALAMRAIALSVQCRFALGRPPRKLVDEVSALIDRALTLDPRSDAAYWARGDIALFLTGDVDAALADAGRVLELNPHFSLGLSLLGQALCYAGRVDEGIAHLRRSIEVDQRDPTNPWRYSSLAIGLFLAGKTQEGLEAVDKGIQTGPPIPEFRLVRTVLLEELGRHDEAAAELALLRRKYPAMTLGKLRLPPFAKPEHLQAFTDKLRTAGLPD